MQADAFDWLNGCKMQDGFLTYCQLAEKVIDNIFKS
jgi:hypothetical protein